MKYKELKKHVQDEQKLNRYETFYKNFKEGLYNSVPYLIRRYMKKLRYSEYYRSKYYETNRVYFYFMWLINRRKKNIIGNKLSIEIYEGSLGWNTIIYHGNIIIHPNAKLEEGCVLHGMNCIGNDGKSNSNVPYIHKNTEICIGAKIIGNVTIGENCVIGADTLVNKSFEKNSIVVGVPAKKIK